MFKSIHKSNKRLSITLALVLAAGVFFLSLTAYAYEEDVVDAYLEAYASEYADDSNADYSGYTDYNVNYYPGELDWPDFEIDGIDISAVSDALDFSAILAALFGGEYSGLLTPDGTATVNDNVFIKGNGLEFFTFTTTAGNVFYLVIDRTSDANNVFFLNAVTEWDLIALAESGDVTTGGGYSVSGIPSPPGSTTDDPNELDGNEEELAEPEAPTGSGGTNGTLIFILIGAAVFGGAAYYVKILRPKQRAANDDEDMYDDPDDYDDDEEDYLSFGGSEYDSDSHADEDEEE